MTARSPPAQMKRSAVSFVLLAALALSGCVTLGPDFEEPDVTWLNDWQSDLYGQIGQPEEQTQTDLRFWMQLFNEPALNSLVETARRENPSLRIAGLRILESRALLGIAGSNRYPQLESSQRFGGQGGSGRERRLGPPGSELHQLSGRLRHWLGAGLLGTISSRHRICQRRVFCVHHQPTGRAGTAERTGGGPVLCLPDDSAANRHRTTECRDSETQFRNHREDIQGWPGLGTRPAAGQDAILVHVGDDTGPRSDTGPASQRACRPARPDAGRACRNSRRSRGICRP